MRRPVDAERIQRFMQALGPEAEKDLRLYFTGGATAVLLGWRSSTVDIDLKLEPDSDRVLQALSHLKDRLEINVELAAPDQFIPEVPGWKDRSVFIAREGRIGFYHYDLYSQALAKIERGHSLDLADVQTMIERGLVDRQELLRRFEQIEPRLHQHPAIDPVSFRQAVEELASAVDER
jgi:uncharacterized nucleotidyltransferase DUF6036